MANTADPFNYDSDGDGFLDWIEFNYGRAQAGALDSNNINQQILGYSMHDILLQHRNPLNPQGAVPYDGVLTFSNTNAQGQNCYTYTQSVLSLYSTLPVTKALQNNKLPNLIL